MLDNIILHEMCIGHVFENTILLGTCIAMWVLSITFACSMWEIHHDRDTKDKDIHKELKDIHERLDRIWQEKNPRL